MIIVLKPQVTQEVIDHVIERIEALGFTPHLSQGVARTIIGVIGDEDKLQAEPLQAIAGSSRSFRFSSPISSPAASFTAKTRCLTSKGSRWVAATCS